MSKEKSLVDQILDELKVSKKESKIIKQAVKENMNKTLEHILKRAQQTNGENDKINL